MDNNTSFQNKEATAPEEEQEQEQEEALSLCDFPLNSDEEDDKTHRHRRSSSQPLDFFEFFNDLNSDTMSHAEDIISGGKLVPYIQQQEQQQQPSIFDDQIIKSMSEDNQESINLSLRYNESLQAKTSPRRSNGSESTRLMRSSRSLDSQKLCRNSSKSEPSDIRRSFSNGSNKPRWCALMFGPMKFPPEMDLRDMKHRQVRRSSGRMAPAMEAGGRSPVNRNDRRNSSWGHDLLRILSCRDYAGVDVVNASVGLFRQV